MKRLISTWALLLTVIGSVVGNSSVDTSRKATYYRVMPIPEMQKFRVFYQPEKEEDVKVLIFNQGNQLIYSEVVRDTEGFAKVFDLTGLSTGNYFLELKSKSASYREMISWDSNEGQNIVISSLKDKKVAMLGNPDASFSLKILDEKGTLIYTDGFNKNEVVNKLYNLQQVEGSEVSFILKKGSKIIREQIVKL